MGEKANLTLNELCQLFRNNGIPASEATLRDLICAGKFTFAVGLDPKPGHRKRRMLISRIGAYQWIENYTGHPAIHE